jgi:hypothetical protein
MDRSILLHLERIDPAKRIEEDRLWRDFEEAKPHILGGIFDILVKAVKIYPQIKLDRLPRMADFTRWGYAISKALGMSGDKFLEAYQRNIAKQNEEVIQSSTLAQAIIKLMEEREEWEKTVKEAWEELNGIITHSPTDGTFPKAPNQLRRHLERIEPNLMDVGITFKIGHRTREGYLIKFQKVCNLGSFDSPDTLTLKTLDLQGEPTGEGNLFDAHLSSPAKSNEININVDGEAGERISEPFWRTAQPFKSEKTGQELEKDQKVEKEGLEGDLREITI